MPLQNEPIDHPALTKHHTEILKHYSEGQWHLFGEGQSQRTPFFFWELGLVDSLKPVAGVKQEWKKKKKQSEQFFPYSCKEDNEKLLKKSYGRA